MPNINLIAARREEKKRLERITRQLFFGLAASIGVFVLLVTYLGARRLALNADLADAQEKIQKLQPTLDRIAEIEKQTNELKPKVDTLQTAKIDTLRWRALFTVISQAIPDNVWIQSMSSGGGDSPVITMTGVASSQSLVGDTMTRLGSHPLFDPKIELDHVAASAPGADGVQQVSFQLNAHMRPPAPPTPSPAPGAAPAGAPAAGTSQAPTAGKTASAGKEGEHHGNAA